MIICPNMKNPDVAREFNELKEATSERAAYAIWSLNNGNAIDKAPNGAESKLFKDLLEYYNGDRRKAIRAKAKTYGKSFRELFGDWIHFDKVNPYSSKISVSNVEPDYDSADANGPGAMFAIFEGDKCIGSIAINANYKGKNQFKTWGEEGTNYVSMSSVGDAVEIEEEFRGKGYGKAAYFEFAKQMANMGYILRSAPARSRTEDATRVWKSLERDGYARQVGDRYEFINSSIDDISKVVDENGEPLMALLKNRTYNNQNSNTHDDYETITELNNYDSSIDAWVIDQIIAAKKDNPDVDILQVAQLAKKQWIESRQLSILNDTQLRIANAYSLRQEVGEDGRIRFVSDSNDEKTRLIINFLDYISGDVQGYYDYNSKSTAAHHVIAISLTNGDPSTFSHELAHHYLKMFENSKLVQTALRAVDKPGMTDEEREEALVDIITAKTNDSKFISSVESLSFVLKFWGALANILYNTFGISSAAIRNTLFKNITKAFVLNELLRSTNSLNIVFKLAEGRKYKNKFKEKLKKARENERKSRSIVQYEQIGSDKTQSAIKGIIQGSISRNKLFRRNNVENPKILVDMQIAEDRVRKFAEDINQYRTNFLNSIGSKPTRALRIQSAYTKEEIDANTNLIRGFIQQAKEELFDIAERFKSMESAQYAHYLSRQVVDPVSGETTTEYLHKSYIGQPDVNVTEVGFKELSEINQNIVGFYKKTITDLYKAIDSEEFKNIYGEDVQREFLNEITSVNGTATGDVRLLNMIHHLSHCYEDAITKLLRQFVKRYIDENAKNLTDEQRELLVYSTNTWLENQNAFGDIGILETWLGLASNSKSSLIRIMLDLIDNMYQDEKDAVNQRGYRLRSLRIAAMNAANKAFFTDDLKMYGAISPFNLDKLLMETDDDGFTGNFISPVNEGKYYNDRTKFINSLLYDKGGIQDKIRQRIGDKKFELDIDNTGAPIFPEGQEDIEKEYLHALNHWTGKHAVRRFTVKYYDKRIDMLSSKTLHAINEIQNQINDIISACTIDGKVHTELLTRTKILDLQTLYYRKQLLSNPFDRYGVRKPDGSDEAQIAEELTAWNEWQSDHIKNKIDYEAYEEAKANAKDKDLFERDNTYRTINPKIWEEISNILPDVSSKQINELRQTRAKLISIIKTRGLVNPQLDVVINRDTGEIRPGYEEFWENLKKYDQLIETLKEQSKGNKMSQKLYLMYKSLITSMPIFITLPNGTRSTWYSYIQKQITARLQAKYGKYDRRVKDEFEKEMEKFQWTVRTPNGAIKSKGPLSIFQITQPPSIQVNTSKGLIDSIIREPISAYSVIDAENSDPDYVDRRFDETVKKSILPLTDDTVADAGDVSYTNHKYKKYIENGPKALLVYYRALMNTMKEGYQNIPFAGQYDGRLPQQGATTGQMFHRNKWWNIGKPILYWFKRTFTINESDTDINVDYELRPDGTRSMNIPVRYIRRLDNPNEINSDVLGSVIDFYEMSQNYKNKSKALPLMLTAVDKLKSSGESKRQETFLRGIINRLFYERSRNIDFTEDKPATYTNKYVKMSLKLVPMLKALTTTGLLALNWLAGFVAFLDPAIQLAVDAISGKYIDMLSYTMGILGMLKRLPLALASAGKSTSYDLISAGMVKFGLSSTGAYNFKHMDRSQIRRFLQGGVLMLPFSLGEHTVNAHVFASTMYSYKYVYDEDTKKATYMNRRLYYEYAQNKGISMTLAKIKFATLPTLMSAYKISKNGMFVPKDNKYGKAVTKDLEKQIGKRMRNRASVSNLIVPTNEHTKIQSNIITAFTVVMRTFMLVGLSERFRSLRDFLIPDDSPVDETKKSETIRQYKKDYYEDKGGYNFQTGEIEDGIMSGVGHILGNLSGYNQYFWYQLKHFFMRSKYNLETKEFMKDHRISETDLYAINRFASELLAFGFLALLLTVFHNKMVDDGDDDKYWYQVVDHILMRAALVRLTWFSPDTFMDLINSITPSKSDVDKKLKLFDLIKDLWIGFQEHGQHYENWEKVKTGGYRNMPKAFRDLLLTFSSLGLHSLYTSSKIEGVKEKTKWFKQLVFWKGFWHDSTSGRKPSGKTKSKDYDEFDLLDQLNQLDQLNDLDQLNEIEGL